MSSDHRRTILVTGASRGIGAAIGRAFAAAGDRVAVITGTAPMRPSRSRRRWPVAAILWSVRTSPTRRRSGVVDAAADRLGGLDVLVNNAGVFRPHPIANTNYEDWQRAWHQTLSVNLVGAANVSWCAAQHMITAGGRSIVNAASRGAFRGGPKQPAYGASKAGLVALGQSLAVALGPHGISVTAVAPGLVDTAMAAENLAGERGELRRAESPLGRIATAEEIAAAVVYLASSQAAMTSGTVLDINGASYLRM